MKSLKHIILSAAAMAFIALAVTSCGKAGHVESLAIPDSANIQANPPAIVGTLENFAKFEPQQCVIDLNDSVFALNDSTYVLQLTITRTQAMPKNSVASTKISNPDSLYSTQPFVVLVDSTGTSIEGTEMVIDEQSLAQLTAMVEGGDETVVLKFTGMGQLTRDQLDEIAKNATRVALVANAEQQVDTSKIDGVLDSFQAAVSRFNREFSSAFGSMGPATGLAMRVYAEMLGPVNAAESRARALKPYFNPSQEARYNQIRRSVK